MQAKNLDTGSRGYAVFSFTHCSFKELQEEIAHPGSALCLCVKPQILLSSGIEFLSARERHTPIAMCEELGLHTLPQVGGNRPDQSGIGGLDAPP